MKKNKSPILQLVGQYLLIFFVFSILFFLLIHSFLLKDQTTVFFRGIILLVITTIVMAAVVRAFKARWNMSHETILAALVMSASVHLALFVLFPVTFDRSITMFVLNTLSKAKNECQGYSSKDLEQKLIRVYIRQNKALDKRIREQENLDFIQKNDQCIQLTDTGKTFVNASIWLKRLYGIK